MNVNFMKNEIRRYILETYQDLGAYDHKRSVSAVGIYNGTDGWDTSDTEDQTSFSDNTDNHPPAKTSHKITHKTVDPYYSGRTAGRP